MFSRYSLQTKFLMGLTAAALVLGVVFAVGFYMHMRTVLETETREKAELIFFQVDSVQNYVRQVLRPAMFDRLDDTFVIQAMSSSYITRSIMDQVRVASERHGDAGHGAHLAAPHARAVDDVLCGEGAGLALGLPVDARDAAALHVEAGDLHAFLPALSR